MVRITQVQPDSQAMEQVVSLHGENAATLGFLPRGAFLSSAGRGEVYAAVNEEEDVVAYLLYATNKRDMLVSIVHLCVAQSVRGQGLARLLFEQLKADTDGHYRGVRVTCRRDYAATALWPKLGFAAVHEKAGRSKSGSVLTLWWFDYGVPDLFTAKPAPRAQAVVDANIFFQLHESPTPESEDVHALLADWLTEHVELCLTQEIYNEIERSHDQEQRKHQRAFASRFAILRSPHDRFQGICRALQEYFPGTLTASDESDLRQLAHAIAAGAHFFVTRDSVLLRKAKEIGSKWAILICQSSDLIVRQDELLRQSEYEPARLAGSRIERRRILSSQIAATEETFRAATDETKPQFRQRLQQQLSRPQVCETWVVYDGNEPLVLIGIDRSSGRQLSVSLLRFLRSTMSATLAKHVVFSLIQKAAAENRKIVTITDPYLSQEALEAASEMSFSSCEQGWVRIVVTEATSSTDMKSAISRQSLLFPGFKVNHSQLVNIVDRAVQSSDKVHMLSAEKSLWPGKITDFDLPAFVVPIRPPWAMNLFDAKLGDQELFGADPWLMFNIENVYYRSCRSRVLTAPSRVLWYVSEGAGDFQQVKAVRACSYIEEVVIDKPKVLFKRFRRLGVYEWRDVYSIAENKIDTEIMAFRFSHTELCDNPIDRKTLSRVWREAGMSGFHIQAPIRIRPELFVELYQLGFSKHKGGA